MLLATGKKHGDLCRAEVPCFQCQRMLWLMRPKVKDGRSSASRAAEALFNFPRLYRAKFAVTGAVLNVVRPFCFKTMVSDEDLFRAACIPEGATICEIGCGDGENFRKISKLVGRTRYTGIDINPAMVQHCQELYPDHDWRVASQPYPFRDDAFDYCIIVNVLHHLNSPQAVKAMLAEAKRISKNVLLFEPLQSEEPLLHWLKRLYWTVTDGGYQYQRLGEFRALFDSIGMTARWERFTSPLRQFYAVHLIRGA